MAVLARASPLLILMSGVAGSGKTWVARRIAPRIGAIHLRSDIERKRLAGVAANADTHSGLQQGLYSTQSSARVYARLQHAAQMALSGGFAVIVDASFLRHDDRMGFRDLAARAGARLALVRCAAPDEVLRERVARRKRAGADASEADLEVLSWQRQNEEPITSEEGLQVWEIDTSDPDGQGAMDRLVLGLAQAAASGETE